MSRYYYVDYGNLIDIQTGAVVRAATRDEWLQQRYYGSVSVNAKVYGGPESDPILPQLTPIPKNVSLFDRLKTLFYFPK